MKLPLLLLAVAGLSTAGSGGADSVRWAPAEILVRWAPGRAKVSRAGLRAVEVLQARYQLVEEGPLLPVRSRGRAKAPGGSGLERWSRLRFRTAEDPRTIAGEYASLELVEEAQPNYLRRPAWTPRDSLFPQQWSLTALGWQEAGPFDAQPVVVGVIDSGVDYDHPDIARQVWRNQPEVEGRPQVDDDGNGYVDDEVGWDFADAPGFPGDGDFLQPDADPQDESGHGTHVAGTIAAVTDNGKGIAAVAPQARVMVLRAGFNLGGGAYLEDDDIAAAMVYAADNGARVLNLSFGDPQFSPLLQDAARYARQAGCVLVGASGNEGQSPVVYPAGFAEAIAVGATGPDGQVLAFSSWGNALDLVAPGYEILSLAPGGGYARRSGTSMAAAHVSGLAALILALAFFYPNA
jgi:subtilisin family serine protease